MKFYDTNAVLELQEEIFKEPFYISSITLEELENIKTSVKKDPEVKYAARKIMRLLDERESDYWVVVYDGDIEADLMLRRLEPSPDNKIVACAASRYDAEFVTGDLCCRAIARDIFKIPVTGIKRTEDKPYTGFCEVVMTEAEMAEFYENLRFNRFDLYIGQYLVIRDGAGEVVDKLKWNGEMHVALTSKPLKSFQLGDVRPYNGDVYQQLAVDSLLNNQVTMLRGKAGTGKSILSLSYLFSVLEKKKIEKIVVFCNTPKTANSVGLGFYPGSRTEKLLDSSIGSMLSSKIGDISGVERLIAEGKLELLPLADIRGYDTTGRKIGVYISEAQNMDIELMKLALQRIGADSIVIIDGDYDTQVDMPQYGGINNGMRRASEIFRGQDFYGEVELQNIYRSRIAQVADEM